VGDLLIKRVASGAPRASDALFHPLTAAAGLYAVQVVLFAYVFVRRWQLGMVALPCARYRDPDVKDAVTDRTPHAVPQTSLSNEVQKPHFSLRTPSLLRGRY